MQDCAGEWVPGSTRSLSRQGEPMPGYADVIFAGGGIYTANPSGRRMIRPTAPDGREATSVAVAGCTIVAGGAPTDGACADLKRARTDRIDLCGPARLLGV